MKKEFLLLLVLFFLGNKLAISQITITKNDFTPLRDNSDTSLIAMQTGMALPSHGENQKWDYTYLTSSGYWYVNPFSNGSTDPDFSDSYSYLSQTFNFQAFSYPGITYYGFDDNGYYKKARKNKRASFPISGITGGANDSLVFNNQKLVFNNRLDLVKFPMTMNDSWEQSRNENTPFTLTVAGFGIFNAPGESRSVRTEKREVVGHGTLQIPDADGNPSAMIEALLVLVTETMTDSFFLGGSPAPTALLGAFGVYQGMSNSQQHYEFYRKGYGYQLMKITINAGLCDRLSFSFNGSRGLSTSINSLEANNTSIYPNPAQPGQVLTIANSTKLANFNVYDINGREIEGVSFTQDKEINTIQLPQNINAGMYFYRVTDEKGNLVISGRFNINY